MAVRIIRMISYIFYYIKSLVKTVNCKKRIKKAKKAKKNVDKVMLEMYIVTRRWETKEILSPNGDAPAGVVIRYNRTVR